MAKPLEKMSADEILSICTKFFSLDFFSFLFFGFTTFYTFGLSGTAQTLAQKSSNANLIIGGIGAVVMFVVSTVWFAIFVNKRLSWGAMGDNLTVVLVKGV